jgi:hypothetical protein
MFVACVHVCALYPCVSVCMCVCQCVSLYCMGVNPYVCVPFVCVGVYKCLGESVC